ncbi:diguanylate cyclase [Thalassomonas viridans]|uniref:diguanylate cyclase n=1 Tax=Thalassomonas viridans TaxID=137584 RepID=A0AAE9Z0N5_9GAMM|nr:diguanylate cyclase [Thalassomonas viridans]WDE03023.1 diguanylate cyclase [Thalassomonas viridans]
MYKILAVDDAKDTLLLLDFDLSAEGYQVVTTDAADSALRLLEKEHFDLILLDMYMPGITGMAALEVIKRKEALKHIPVIMLSAADGEDEIVSALELGADDYVTKPYIAKVLLARIRTSLRLMEKNRELEILATTDFLTGINNRGRFYELSTKAFEQSVSHTSNLVLAMFDIDLFKKVNDNYGHEAGDTVLVEFTQLMGKVFREHDIIGRLGGEEFAVCFPHTAVEEAINACERFRLCLEQHAVMLSKEEGQTLFVTVSIGVASTHVASPGLDDLIRRADLGLYEAKNSGRNKIINADELQVVNQSQRRLIDYIDTINEEEAVEPVSQSQASQTQPTQAQLPPSRELPGIDQQIGLGNVLGDESLFREILVMFYQDHHDDKEKLQSALAGKDSAAAKHLAHTLKGVASSVGAMSLFERAKALDNAISGGEIEQYQLLFEGVAAELLKVMAGIEQELAEQLHDISS